MRSFRALIPTSAGVVLGLVVAANSSSAAMSCRPWLRLNPGQKEATVHAMIDDALRSNRGRQYDINRGAVGRCLHGSASQMAVDFDDVCSDSRSADMQAIHKVFKSYVWSCAG